MHPILPFFVLLTFATAICGLLSVVAWQRKETPGSRPFALLMMMVAIWCFLYALQLASFQITLKTTWALAQYPCIAFVPIFWLSFVLLYTGRTDRMMKRYTMLLTIIPAATTILAITNPWHGLIMHDIHLIQKGPMLIIGRTFGMGFWVHSAYSYSLLFIGTLLLILSLFQKQKLHRGQFFALISGALAPWIGNAIYIFGLSSFLSLDPTPFLFTISGVLFAIAIFQGGMLNVMPVAYSAVVNNMRDSIVILNNDDIVLGMNPAAEQYMRVRAAEAVGQPAGVVFSKWPELVNRYRKITNGEAEISFGQGDEKTVFDMKINAFHRRGRLGGRMFVFRDITRIKQREYALRESEKKFRSAFTNSAHGMSMVDPNGWILEVNPYFCEMLGYAREELAGKNVQELTAPEDFGIERSLHRQLIRGEIPYVWLEKRYLAKNGALVWGLVSSSLIRDEAGAPLYFIANIQNITEQKTASEQLLQSEQRYRSLVENTMDGYFIFSNSTGRFLFLNSRICEILGISLSEGLSQRITDVMDEKEWPEFTEWLEKHKAAADAGRGPRTFTIHRKGDSAFQAEISLSRVTYEGRDAFQGILRDITEKQHLETKLRQAQKMEAIGTLAGGIAHDFNNILMGIQGNTSLMLIKTDSDHPFFEKMKNIERYVSGGSELTRQLLGFARSGKYQVKAIDMNKLIDKTANMFWRTKKEIQIRPRYTERLWAIEADQSQMEQVLLNLYVNAWQAMPTGGEITLETANTILSAEKSKALNIEPGKYVLISVMDTGIGMTEETQRRIFDPFFTTKAMGRGTGLGLASAYGIIKNHGGNISVWSRENEGSRFSIYLPASEKTIESEIIGEQRETGGTETILLVDDEDTVLEVSCEILETMGYRVLTADSGESCIDIYRKKKDEIDLVVLDMVMPGTGGGTTFDKLRKLNPAVKVLLSSGYSIDGQASEILERGCNGFIQKPFNLQKISKKVRDILDVACENEEIRN